MLRPCSSAATGEKQAKSGSTHDSASSSSLVLPHYARERYEPGKMGGVNNPKGRGDFAVPEAFEDPWMSPEYEEARWKVDAFYPRLCAMGLQPHLADLHVKGYCVIPPELYMPAEDQTSLKAALLRLAEKRSGGIPSDERTGASYTGMNYPFRQFMRCVPFKDPTFEPILTNPMVLDLVSHILGPDAIL